MGMIKNFIYGIGVLALITTFVVSLGGLVLGAWLLSPLLMRFLVVGMWVAVGLMVLAGLLFLTYKVGKEGLRD